MTVKITPLDHVGEIVELSDGSNVFEKQVLPYGRFNYKGTTFEITPTWVDGAIKSFEDKAFDQTVFALADENNSHDVDNRPDRYGGEVVKFLKRPTGLNAVFKLTNKAASLVRENKKLGVSVRFHNGYTRESDGRSWPVAIDQVLGTLNPRITGMPPWKEVVLSNVANGVDVEDSSNGEWEMPEENQTDPTDSGVTLSKEEYAAFQALLAAKKGDDSESGDNSNVTTPPSGTDDAEVEAALIQLLKGHKSGERKVTKDQLATVGLSNTTEDSPRVVELSQRLATSDYERDAVIWRNDGVPPRLIELARPVLTSYEPVVSLSDDGKSVDARTIVKAILDECKGTIVLSQEDGHAGRAPGSQQDAEFKKAYEHFIGQVTQF